LNNRKQFFLQFSPSSPEYSFDEKQVAIDFQSRNREISYVEIIESLGPPTSVCGSPEAGHIAYQTEDNKNISYVYDISNNLIVSAGSVSNNINNAIRADEKTGKEIQFNIFNEFVPFQGSAFAKNT
jgi:hypothetical protein